MLTAAATLAHVMFAETAEAAEEMLLTIHGRALGRRDGRRKRNRRNSDEVSIAIPDTQRPERPEGDRPERPDGDRPDGDKPERPDGDRPDGDKPERPDGDKPERPDGDKPERPDGDKPDRPDGDKPERPDGDKPGNKPNKGKGNKPVDPCKALKEEDQCAGAVRYSADFKVAKEFTDELTQEPLPAPEELDFCCKPVVAHTCQWTAVEDLPPRPERPERPEGDKPEGDRPERPDGDKPQRPERPDGDKPQRPERSLAAAPVDDGNKERPTHVCMSDVVLEKLQYTHAWREACAAAADAAACDTTQYKLDSCEWKEPPASAETDAAGKCVPKRPEREEKPVKDSAEAEPRSAEEKRGDPQKRLAAQWLQTCLDVELDRPEKDTPMAALRRALRSARARRGGRKEKGSKGNREDGKEKEKDSGKQRPDFSDEIEQLHAKCGSQELSYH